MRGKHFQGENNNFRSKVASVEGAIAVLEANEATMSFKDGSNATFVARFKAFSVWRGLWICCRWDEAVGQTEQICTLLFSEAFFNASELDEASDEVRKKHQTGRPEVDAEFLKTKGRKLWDALSKASIFDLGLFLSFIFILCLAEVDLILEQVKQSA